MPYIKNSQRKDLQKALLSLFTALRDVEGSQQDAKGIYNYTITRICHDYINYHGLNYSNVNDVMGILSGAQQEFYRTVAAPYEDKKIKENGDVKLDLKMYETIAKRNAALLKPKSTLVTKLKNIFKPKKTKSKDVALGI